MPQTDQRSHSPENRVRRSTLSLVARLHRWAESGWANSATGTWALLQSSVVPGPSEALLIPLGLADPRRAFRLAAWAIGGALLGGLLAYWLGMLAFGHAADLPIVAWAGLTPAHLASMRALFERYGWLMVVAGSLPVLGSAKMASYAAGAFALPLPQFALALLVGRVVRFLAVALLLRYAGARVVAWVERRTGRTLSRLSGAAPAL
jgi:membrane protein YqaA with SNARE-associated domain